MTFRNPKLSLARAAFCLFLPLVQGCGSSPQAESPAEAQSREAGDPEPDSKPEEAKPGAAPPGGTTCAEMGCFSCGEGTCPKGSYCDETKPERSACSWLSDCGEAPSCACLTRILGAACSCEESEGSARIRCAD